MMPSFKKWYISETITVFVAIFTIYFQLFPPQTPKDKFSQLILFIGVLIYILISYSILFMREKVKLYIVQINKNTEEIEKIKETMDIEKKFYEIDKRLIKIESSPITKLIKNRKGGNLDPRWLILIGLLILFYLYLRASGFLN